ncbi:uncharacterized protein DS421_18g616220 [Arachis hypogaea]|nr:uncharacterized protein DS421_18g616220 [Arachis hypogaea]
MISSLKFLLTQHIQPYGYAIVGEMKKNSEGGRRRDKVFVLVEKTVFHIK